MYKGYQYGLKAYGGLCTKHRITVRIESTTIFYTIGTAIPEVRDKS